MRLPASLLIAALLSGCGTMQIGERNFLRPDHKSGTAPATFAAADSGAYADEQIDAGDGVVLRGVSWRQPNADTALLYFGGNAFNIDKHGPQVFESLRSCGVNVTVFDHRGYGRSSGTPTIALLAADGLRAFDHLNQRFPGRVIMHGQSLGSFIAAHAARERPAARALVLESTTSSVQDWVDVNVPWYVKAVTKVEVEPALRSFDNVSAARGYAGPALVMTGQHDRTTPPHLALKVFDALPSTSKKWLLAPAAGHNDVLGNASVMPAYCGFLNTHR